MSKRKRLEAWAADLDGVQKVKLIVDLVIDAINTESVSFHDDTKYPYCAYSGEPLVQGQDEPDDEDSQPAVVVEPCPRCERKYPQGPYLTWMEELVGFTAPSDVQCECGLILRATIPLMPLTASGWHWEVKKNRSMLRIKGDSH